MSGFPYFKFFPADWLGSTSVACMTLEQQGAYIRLMAHAWQAADCGLPDDDAALAMLSGLGERWAADGTVLRRMFRWRSSEPPDGPPASLDELPPAMPVCAFEAFNGRCYNRKLVRLKRESVSTSEHRTRAARTRWS